MAARGRLLLTRLGCWLVSMLGGIIVADERVSSGADRRFPAGTFSALTIGNDTSTNLKYYTRERARGVRKSAIRQFR